MDFSLTMLVLYITKFERIQMISNFINVSSKYQYKDNKDYYLGRGTFRDAYKGKDILTHEDVAIKIINIGV